MNMIHIEPTKFTYIKSGIESFGVIIFDNNKAVYDNTWPSIPESDMEVLREASGNCLTQGQVDIFDNMEQNELDCYIGENLYSWEKIKDIVKFTNEF